MNADIENKFESALNRVIEATGVERYRWLCSEANPDVATREGYRRLVLERAGEKPSKYPSLFTMAGNALTAAARFVGDGLALVDDAEQGRRLAICRGAHRRTIVLCHECEELLEAWLALPGQAAEDGPGGALASTAVVSLVRA